MRAAKKRSESEISTESSVVIDNDRGEDGDDTCFSAPYVSDQLPEFKARKLGGSTRRHHKFLRAIADHVPANHASRIADIGCGKGALIPEWCANVGGGLPDVIEGLDELYTI